MAVRRFSVSLLSLALAVFAGAASAQTWSPDQQEIWRFEEQQWKMAAEKDLSWIDKMVHRIVDGHGRKDDLDTILDVAKRGAGTTICAFYDGAVGPYVSYIEKFRAEFEALVHK